MYVVCNAPFSDFRQHLQYKVPWLLAHKRWTRVRGLEGYQTSVTGNESYEMVWRTIISAYVVSRHTLGKYSDRRENYSDCIVVDWPVRCVEALQRHEYFRETFRGGSSD